MYRLVKKKMDEKTRDKKTTNPQKQQKEDELMDFLNIIKAEHRERFGDIYNSFNTLNTTNNEPTTIIKEPTKTNIIPIVKNNNNIIKNTILIKKKPEELYELEPVRDIFKLERKKKVKQRDSYKIEPEIEPEHSIFKLERKIETKQRDLYKFEPEIEKIQKDLYKIEPEIEKIQKDLYKIEPIDAVEIKYNNDNKIKQPEYEQVEQIKITPENEPIEAVVIKCINDTKIKQGAYYRRLDIKTDCAICTKSVNLGKIKCHWKTKTCSLIRSRMSEEEISKIENDVKILCLNVPKK
jgi:hypothetical protein